MQYFKRARPQLGFYVNLANENEPINEPATETTTKTATETTTETITETTTETITEPATENTSETTKGHLISEKICEDIDFQTCNENIARISDLVYKYFQDTKPSNIFNAILENHCLHKIVLRLSDLYRN